MGADGSTDDEQAIREVVDAWMAASEAGDTGTVLDLMTDDVLFVGPGREPFGKEAFADAAEAQKDVDLQGTSDVREVEVLGDRAYLRNHIEMTMTTPDGPPVRLRAHDTAKSVRRGVAAGV